MTYYTLLRRNHTTYEPSVDNNSFVFGGNIAGWYDTVDTQIYTDTSKVIRGFGLLTDPNLDLVGPSTRPALNATDRWPAEDFSLNIPKQALQAFDQTCHCRILGLATMTMFNGAGMSIANVVASGDETTFDILIPAGVQALAYIKFTNTKRTAASGTGTGIRGLTIRNHGYALDATTIMEPVPRAAFAKVQTLRMHDFTRMLDNIWEVDLADRASDTIRPKNYDPNSHAVYRSIEDAIRVCNEVGTNLWWNIPMAASDAYVTGMATIIRDNLDPTKYCMFEYGNENWNFTLSTMQHDWNMQRAMEIVDGCSFQYVQSKVPLYWRRISNVITVEFAEPHGLIVGDVFRTSIPTFLTVAVASVPTSTSITYANTGSNTSYANPGRGEFYRAGRSLQSAIRAGTVMTITFGHDHGWSVGKQIKCSGINGITTGALISVVTVPSARSITVDCAAGTDGPSLTGSGGASAIVADFSNILNSYDGESDQNRLKMRRAAYRQCQISDLVRAVYTSGEWGVRAKIGLYGQTGGDQYDVMRFITAQIGTPNHYLHAMGASMYCFLDASTFGGANMKNVSTYNGNTPPLKSDYIDAWNLTFQAAKTAGASCGAWDEVMQVASDYGLEQWMYEFGPDATSDNPVNGTASSDARYNKIGALFDPAFKPIYRAFLDSIEAANFKVANVYHMGSITLPSNDEYSSWPIFEAGFATPSPRTEALDEKIVAPRTGPTRNLIAATGTTEVSGKRTGSVYNDDAASFPSCVPGAAGTWRGWIITTPEGGDYEVSMQVQSTSGARTWKLRVNTVLQAPLYTTGGTATVTTTPIVCTLRQGVNHLVTEYATTVGGTFHTLIKWIFTRV